MDGLHPGLLASIDARFTVLVPSRRAAYAIRLAYGQRAIAAGRRAWLTPDVLTVRAWIERTWLASHPSHRLKRLLTAPQALVLWERIVAESPEARLLLNPTSMARTAARSWELAHSFTIPLDAIGPTDGIEAETFARWATQFETLCAKRRWVAPGAIARELLESSALIPARLHLALIDQLSPMEELLIARVVAAGGEVRRGEAGQTLGMTAVCASTDAAQELLDAAEWARTQLTAGRTSIGIVVPALATQRHTVRRVLEDVFVPASRRSGEPHGAVPFTIGASGRLDEFPIVRAALDVLALCRGHATGSLAGGLLRSPFLGGYMSEAANRARADLRLRAQAAEHYDVAALERLAGANDCVDFAKRLVSLRAALPRAGAKLLPSEWAERLLALWTAIGWPGERTATSEEQQTLSKLNAALSEFGGLDDLLGPISFQPALLEFERWVGATSFEPQTLPAAIAVLDPESAAGMRFESLWILGCDAATWPPAPQPDPFIPVRLQRTTGLPQASAADAYDRAHRQFSALRHSAEVVISSFCLHVDDAENSPSPFLFGLPVYEPTRATGSGLRGWLQARRPVLDRVLDVSAPAAPAGKTTGGSRLIELQSLCPFRAQAELRLNARPLNQVSPGIDPMERGLLLHSALEALWGEFRDQDGLKAIDSATLRSQVHELVNRLSVPMLTGASAHRARLVAIEVDIATHKICELLALERERPPFAVLERPEFVESYSASGLVLSLKIDRIDRLQTARPDAALQEVVIDYKTGTSANPAKWWGSRPEQPQLPLYAVARRQHLAGVAFALLNARQSGFKGVVRSDGILPGLTAHPATRNVPPDALTWDAMLDGWQRTVNELIGGFARGDARVVPLPHACDRCHLASLCRIDELNLRVDDQDEVGGP